MARKKNRFLEELLCAPNLLTLSRIVVIPFVLLLMDDRDPVKSFYAAVLFALASVTDGLDGYLARRTGRITLVGKFLDPLADKLLVMACLVYMVRIGRVDEWLAVVLIAREMSITGLRAIAGSEGLVIAASLGGKNKTVFQLAGIGTLILHFPYPILFTPFVVDFHIVGTYLLYVSLLFSIFSAIEYVQLFIEAIEQKDRSRKVEDL